MRQPILVEHPLIDLGGKLLPVFLDVIDGKMLERCRQLQVARVVALQSTNKGHAHAAGQERVFAVTLIDAAPVRIAADVDYRHR